MELPEVVSKEQWQQAHERLLAEEKAAMRASDALAAKRRRLPAVEVPDAYEFEGPGGRVRLGELFEGRSQLITYHFMYDAGAEPCTGCSMFADNLPHLAHLNARDTTLALVSRGPWEQLEAHRRRMGWEVPWYSIVDGDFNEDLGVHRGFGLNVLLRDDDRFLRTYFTSSRGVESLGTVWELLDRTPLGRQEDWEDSPSGRPQESPYRWWRLHDEYEAA